jgi:two-component system cell cycle sensor histidine kinase/response regulator CckA
VRPDGEERLAEISATANVLPGQHIAVLRDISSRRAGELALFDSEARFRGAFDQAPIGMALVAPDGSWLEVNKAICDLVGYSEAELLQTNFQALTHPDDLAADLEQLEATLAGEIDSYTMEKRYFHKDGHVVVVLLSVSLVRDHAGTPRYFVSQVKDIGERKQAEQLQAASERRYRDLFENAYDALYSLDAEGRLTDANRAFEHLAGRSLDEMLGHSIVGILAPDSRGAGRRRLAARLLGRSPHGFECTITSREGAHVQVEITSRLIVENGEVVGVQGVAREIGTRKRLEEERRLGQKLEAVGRLAGGIAHDFNNLLTAIRGYTDLALLRAGAETPLDEILEIRRAAEQASRLTRQLLAFGRKQVLELRVLDLNSVVASTETMLRRVIGEQVQLETKLGADLGRVKADPSQLEQVIVNLVVNARDAMSEGGRVTIETARLELDEESARQHPPVPAGRYVTLTVTDTGRGIDAKTRRQLFEPFFTTKEPGHGTGLGLATVYGIVKQSRGYIRVDSEPGAGARFTIYLQAVREPLTKDERELPPRRPDAKRAAARILVAEDEEIVRRLLSKILAADGHTVLAAANGEEALELARASDVELLITDVVMPGMGGPELLRRLREGKPDLPAIYISGHSEAAVSRNGKLSPGAIFVQKPFAYEELAATVAALLT